MNNELSGVLKKVRNLIQENELKPAGAALLEISDRLPSRFRNEILVHKASIRQFDDDQRRGVINADTANIRKKQIMFSVLDLLDEISDQLSEAEREEIFSEADKFSTDTQRIVFGGDVRQVVIQNLQNGNNIMDNQQKNFSISGVSGSVNISAPITIADTVENSFNQLSESNVRDDIKSILEDLLIAVNELNKAVLPEQSEAAQAMVRDAEALIKETASAKPRKKWYELSIEGLKEAAESLGSVASPVLAIVEKIAGCLLL